MTPDEWSAKTTWLILVEECGASTDPDAELEFVHALTEGHCGEFRFMGTLGFGGKYWPGDRRVSCYPEDQTPERLAAIACANARLAALPDGQS